MEVKDGLIDEAASKTSPLERDIKDLIKKPYIRGSDNRLRTQQLTNQLDSLNSDLSKLGLNATNVTAPNSDSDKDRYKALESMLEETLKRSVEVREEKIASLESRLTESVNRNKELRNQFMDVRSELESLRQRHQEEDASLSEDVTREVTKLRDTLYRTAEEKVSLENETSELKTQTASYREQVCALQSQVTSLSNQNTVMSQHNARLQGDNAKLQVENTTLQSQSASLIAQNSALQSTATQMHEEKDKARRSCDERGSRLSQLVGDHEALQRLHQQLTREYDQLTKEQNNLKSSHKTLRHDHKLLKDRQSDMSASEDELLKLREALEDEMAKLKCDSTTLNNLRGEHSRLKDDFRSLFSANDKLRAEYKSLQGDYKAIKTENNTVKLRLTELNGELNDTRDQMGVLDVEVSKLTNKCQLLLLDVEVSKLTNKCQVLQTLNLTLEEDRRSLMSQVSLLLTQYHDLLTQTLEDKQHFHQEEKNFTDKLNNLRRGKEKLEEKIMEQYRRMDNSPAKKKGFGSNLVRRVRKAGTELISKVPRSGRSRSRGRDEGGIDGESPDSSSLGSSSQANDSMDSGSETRRSSPNLPPPSPPQLTPVPFTRGRIGPKKSLPPALSDLYASHILRGSVSSEDVVSLRSAEVSEFCVDDSLSTVTESGEMLDRTPYWITRVEGDLPSVVHPHLSVNRYSTGVTTVATAPSPRVPPPAPPPPPPLPPAVPPEPPPPRQSPDESERWTRTPPRPPLTPRLPPRADHINSVPQVPPRSRRGSNVTQPEPTTPSTTPSTPLPSTPLPSTPLSSQSLPIDTTTTTTTTTTTPKPPPPPPPPRPTPTNTNTNTNTITNSEDAPPLKTGKDIVDNSVWYEYGCV
ncbi:hypothetical protein Pcinc_042174 [Petrolisthes cinctipes]|uniref:Girdin n=2 Tax=Petrolisthes cinctipes TaxID=88211 RepID=A0AAE1BIT8_PETCI|nr:hypothetical protein Pcinc_042174 [Petrolisthes cinctipes]